MNRALPFILLLLTASLGWAQSSSPQHSYTVTGTVTDAKTGETLIGATIYDTLSHKGTVTNQHGRYSLTLKGDTAVIRISFVGCETQFHSVALNANHRIDAKLISSHTLKEVRVVGERVEHIESSIPSRIEIPVEQVKAMPMLFGETDVIKAIQLLPGVQNGSEGTAGMYVRGGGPDENLFLLDGIPMYNVNHLGGFFSAFNSDAVKNIQLYKGSFPARFGSRLSSVLDITTNNGNDKEYHGGVSIGLISAKAYVEGPIVKEKTTFSVSARRTYGDILLQPILALIMREEGENGKLNGGYYFYDFNAKVTHRFSDRSRLYASYYMGLFFRGDVASHNFFRDCKILIIGFRKIPNGTLIRPSALIDNHNGVRTVRKRTFRIKGADDGKLARRVDPNAGIISLGVRSRETNGNRDDK